MKANNSTFAGLHLSLNSVIFNENGFGFTNDWKENSYDKIYGKKVGSTYFNYNEAKDIDVDGWRVPTQKEWTAIVGTKRKGATYNGQEHACFALIRTNVPFGGRKVCNGLLLFPDGTSINGVEIGNVNKTFLDDQKNYRQTQDVTEKQLNDLLAQGCAFLPASGYDDDEDDWYGGGSSGYYWSSTEYAENYGYGLYFDDSYLNPEDYDLKEGLYYSVRLVRE